MGTEFKSICCIDRVDGEDDLKLRPGTNLNPPPSDGRCHCCEKHISQLKPFGKAGDPLVGDFDGAYLVKKFRPDAPYCKLSEEAMLEAEKHADPTAWLIEKYGEKEAEMISLRVDAHGSVGKSWECRDCAILDENEYFEIRSKLPLCKEVCFKCADGTKYRIEATEHFSRIDIKVFEGLVKFDWREISSTQDCTDDAPF